MELRKWHSTCVTITLYVLPNANKSFADYQTPQTEKILFAIALAVCNRSHSYNCFPLLDPFKSFKMSGGRNSKEREYGIKYSISSLLPLLQIDPDRHCFK